MFQSLLWWKMLSKWSASRASIRALDVSILVVVEDAREDAGTYLIRQYNWFQSLF